jgi:hypothetical protein
MNRYYSNVTGRFFSPDPSGIRTADPKDPRSWNRYAYVNGDPANFADPTGRFCIHPDALRPQYEPDDPWDPAPDCGVEGPVGGGNPCIFGDAFAPVPGPDCYAPGPVAAAPAAALVVTSLHITSDCWLAYNPKTAPPSRDTTFVAFDGGSDLSGENIVITESVTTSPRGPLATNLISDPNSNGTGGVFNDQKGLSYWQAGTYTVYQSFMVSVNGGPAYSVPVLFSGALDPALIVTLSGTYGSFSNWWRGRKNYDVIVNGQGKNKLPACNQGDR